MFRTNISHPSSGFNKPGRIPARSQVARCSIEMSVDVQLATLSYIPGESTLHNQSSMIVKSYLSPYNFISPKSRLLEQHNCSPFTVWCGKLLLSKTKSAQLMVRAPSTKFESSSSSSFTDEIVQTDRHDLPIMQKAWNHRQSPVGRWQAVADQCVTRQIHISPCRATPCVLSATEPSAIYTVSFSFVPHLDNGAEPKLLVGNSQNKVSLFGRRHK
jgi:hypothetical protein